MSSQGLEGIIAAQSSISSIVGATLTYRGYNIDDLADYSDFEEVVYLLWHDKLPNMTELNEFKKELANSAEVPVEVLDSIRTYPKGVNTMAALRTAISQLGFYDPEAQDLSAEANLRKAKRLLGQISTIVAAFHRIRLGLEPVAPDTSLSYAANFLYMLNGTKPESVSVEAFNKALVLHADHEFNASTFSSRVTVATLSDMHSGMVAAVGTLKGPLHGGANEQVMTMLEEIQTVDNVEPYLEKKFANKEKVMGIGHRVYKQGDPRAKHLKEMSRQLAELTGDTKWYNMSIKIDSIVTERIGLLPNVDFYSASVYTYLGIPRDLFTPIFAISRTSGWTAHMIEQYTNNRLIRPRAEYTGSTHEDYVPIGQR